jgi:hypothetical protein
MVNKSYSKKLIFTLWIVGNLLFLFQVEWLTIIFKLIGSISVNFRMISLVIEYTNSNFESPMSIGYIERQFTFIVVFLFSDKLIRIDKKNIAFINLVYIYLFIFLYCAELVVMIARVAMLFIVAYWVVYPKIYYILSKKNKYLFIILMGIYGILKIGQANSLGSAKYENILFNHNSVQERITWNITTDSYWKGRGYLGVSEDNFVKH